MPKLPEIDKVTRDPEFDHIADNNHPTIIGYIGTFTENENNINTKSNYDSIEPN